MSPVLEQRVFEDDVFIPGKFGEPQRIFLLKHVGETPRQAGFVTDPRSGDWVHPELPRAVWVEECRIACARFFDESQSPDRSEAENLALLNKCRRALLASIEFANRCASMKEQFGYVDYALVGIGLDEGQTPTDRLFAVDLSPKFAAPSGNFAQDLIDKFADESDIGDLDEALAEAIARDKEEQGRDDQAINEAVEQLEQLEAEEAEEELPTPQISVACPVTGCDWTPKEGDNAPMRALHAHVRAGHKDEYEQMRPVLDLMKGQLSQ